MSGNRDKTPYRFDLLIPEFLEHMARAMAEGHEKYDDDRPFPNWQYGLEGDKDPVNHAYAHLTAYHDLRNQKDGKFFHEETVHEMAEHLAHLACNAMMEYRLLLYGVRIEEGPEPKDFLGFAEHNKQQIADIAEVQPTAADVLDLLQEPSVPTASTFAPPPPTTTNQVVYNKSLLDQLKDHFSIAVGKVSE